MNLRGLSIRDLSLLFSERELGSVCLNNFWHDRKDTGNPDDIVLRVNGVLKANSHPPVKYTMFTTEAEVNRWICSL